MPRERFGTFTVRDAMILVAVAGLSLWAGENFLLWVKLLTLNPDDRIWSLLDYFYWAQVLVTSMQPILAVWSLAVLALMLRRPRPPLRSLTRMPGFVACCAASVVIPIGGAMNFMSSNYFQKEDDPFLPRFLAYIKSSLVFERGEVGLAVAACWLVLALRGWRSEASWLDRLGRLLGVYWIVIIPLARFPDLFR